MATYLQHFKDPQPLAFMPGVAFSHITLRLIMWPVACGKSDGISLLRGGGEKTRVFILSACFIFPLDHFLLDHWLWGSPCSSGGTHMRRHGSLRPTAPWVKSSAPVKSWDDCGVDGILAYDFMRGLELAAALPLNSWPLEAVWNNKYLLC